MTTHTDLIARLRGYHICTVSNNEAADALEALEQQVATMKAVAHLEKVRAENAEQQVAALTKERDELEISNAFAHGEWRAVKDQLAAMTTERNHLQSLTVVNESLPVPALRRQLAASQADNARLRDALESIRSASDAGDWPDEFETIAIPADDSALMERLKEERDRCALLLDNASGKGSIISCVSAAAAIRSMT